MLKTKSNFLKNRIKFGSYYYFTTFAKSLAKTKQRIKSKHLYG